MSISGIALNVLSLFYLLKTFKDLSCAKGRSRSYLNLDTQTQAVVASSLLESGAQGASTSAAPPGSAPAAPVNPSTPILKEDANTASYPRQP